MEDKAVTTLFEGDEWTICESTTSTPMPLVFACHIGCADPKGRSYAFNSWWCGDTAQSCIVCREPVPDEIQALVFLYTYDG